MKHCNPSRQNLTKMVKKVARPNKKNDVYWISARLSWPRLEKVGPLNFSLWERKCPGLTHFCTSFGAVSHGDCDGPPHMVKRVHRFLCRLNLSLWPGSVSFWGSVFMMTMVKVTLIKSLSDQQADTGKTIQQMHACQTLAVREPVLMRFVIVSSLKEYRMWTLLTSTWGLKPFANDAWPAVGQLDCQVCYRLTSQWMGKMLHENAI